MSFATRGASALPFPFVALPGALVLVLVLASCSSTRAPTAAEAPAPSETATYDLNSDSRPAGTVFEARSQMLMPRTKATVVDTAGDTLRTFVAHSEVRERKRIKVLRVEEGKATKQRETYLEDFSVNAMPSRGRSDTTYGALRGKTVTHERVADDSQPEGEQWEFTFLDGRKLTDTQKKELASASPVTPSLHRSYPSGTPNVGEEWTVEGDALAEHQGVAPEDFEGRMTVRFDSISTCRGTPCAVMSMQMRARITTSTDVTEGDAVQVLRLRGTQQRALDGPYNLKVELQGSMEMRGRSGERRMSMVGPMRLTSTQEIIEHPGDTSTTAD